MIGLALQGGGSRGAYQAGAALAFKKMKVKFDGVCGTSIGAFNGAMIVCGKEKQLVDLWQNIDMAQILGFNKEYIKKKQRREFDWEYCKLYILNLINILKTRGIKITGLEETLKNNLTEEEIKNSPKDFGICTIRLKDLKPLYIFKEDMIKGKLFDYILASCYLPIFRMEKRVDEHYYIDGGFYDNTPLNMLIDKGYKKIYVVELNPLLNINRKPKQNVEIIKISPKRSLGGVVDFDLDSIKEHIYMGYYDTLRVLKKLDGYYYCFKKRPNWYYKWLIRKVPSKELKRIKLFFNAKNEKELVIKALEYVLKNEEVNYYDIYNSYFMVKFIKQNIKKDHFVYNFIRKLNIL